MLRLFADLAFRWKIALPIIGLAVLLLLTGGLGVRGISQEVESSTRLTDCLSFARLVHFFMQK